MTTFVHIGEILHFSTNNGIIVKRGALDVSSDELAQAVRTAYEHVNEPVLRDSCCGGCGPLADRMDTSFEDFLAVIEQERVRQATIDAKRAHTKIRRSQYRARRPELVLSIIEAGTPYACAYPGCDTVRDLTVDHILPLSRGGSDEIGNLQFLCRIHNSSKGDQIN